ncbi:MAG: nickel-dependent lactate racemase [Anaerolineae bacterium]|nr:nickel-dependent lactate racemase [Anaerolineae bacterium]
MQFKLAYGKTGLTITLPDAANVTVVEPAFVAALPDQIGAVRDALRDPIGAQALRETVNASDTVGIVFSDITRPTPNHILLPALLAELDHVPDEQIVLFNATGTHRPNTESELRTMLGATLSGDAIVDRFRIVQNDANDRASHELIGTTSRGNDVWLHREFLACAVQIPTGFIEPHFFAGYSGAGKAIMPGLALLETILRNHSAVNLDDPRTTWGHTTGNPLWEEVREVAQMAAQSARVSFLLNVTLNRDKAITGVFAGAMDQAHAAGCAFVKDTAMVPVAEAFDMVITSNSGYPLDLNLYQTVKGMSAAALVVKPGGTIIAAADCWDGLPDHGEYAQLLHSADSPAALLEMVRAPGYQRQDMWQGHIQALVSQKAEVYVYSDHLTDAQLEAALLKPCRNIGALVADLLTRYGSDASICVLPEGPQTIPYLAEQA